MRWPIKTLIGGKSNENGFFFNCYFIFIYIHILDVLYHNTIEGRSKDTEYALRLTILYTVRRLVLLVNLPLVGLNKVNVM